MLNYQTWFDLKNLRKNYKNGQNGLLMDKKYNNPIIRIDHNITKDNLITEIANTLNLVTV